MDTPLLEGFLLGLSMIAAIGVQNLFVLRQGIIGQHTFLTASLCCACDFFLVSIGSMGAGSIIAESTWLKALMVGGGVVFLCYYAGRSFLNILKGQSLELLSTPQGTIVDRRTIILSALGFSLLNPHAILDTVVLIGGLSGQFSTLTERSIFALGVAISSVVWFFSIAYGARLFGPMLCRRNFAIALDLFTGCLMSWIAFDLVKAHFTMWFT
jgi:L-lysine exporter family protein LysE/ArgO